MPEYVTPREAVSRIKSGSTIGINAFLTLVNPIDLLNALGEYCREDGGPRDLTIFCSAGFGSWTEDSPCEEAVRSGAVRALVCSHYASMPSSSRMIVENKIEGYNLPFGVMSHMVRAASSGLPYYITHTGQNLFCDPRNGGSRLNERSRDEWVADVTIEGERFLRYRTPKLDAVFIKGTSADDYGNISFEREPTTLDAFSAAMAARASGGIVIVQVQRRIKEKQRPWNVIIPGAFVDYICVCPDQDQIVGFDEYEPAISGDEFIAPEEMDHWLRERLSGGGSSAREVISARASRELRPGHVANIGIGIPESVAELAVRNGLLPQITLTVETGAFGGMPYSGKAFGSSVGSQAISTTAEMFDLYDSGSLDICFLGALEIDRHGNVNAHHSAEKLAGIGGFANISQHAKKVVFCASFSSGGLRIGARGDTVTIDAEGRFHKFVREAGAVSFSAYNAQISGQKVLYVTERCVFRLTEAGLMLTEVYNGVDIERDVLDKLPFEPLIDESLKTGL